MYKQPRNILIKILAQFLSLKVHKFIFSLYFVFIFLPFSRDPILISNSDLHSHFPYPQILKIKQIYLHDFLLII